MDVRNFEEETNQQTTMRPLKSLMLLTMILAIFACQKEVPQPSPPPVPGIPDKFVDLTVAPNFSWSTLQEVNLRFDGYQAPVSVDRKFAVRIPNSNNIILTAYLPISAQSDFRIQIPTSASELEIQYGAVVKRIPVSANMSFSPKPEFE